MGSVSPVCSTESVRDLYTHWLVCIEDFQSNLSRCGVVEKVAEDSSMTLLCDAVTVKMEVLKGKLQALVGTVTAV